MGVPARMLPHVATLVRPAETTNAYGDTVYEYGESATRKDVKAWVQQDQRSQVPADGRDPLRQRWLLVTDHADVQRRDHVEWTGPQGLIVFVLDGQPEPAYTPAGFHHTEVILKEVDG